MKLFLLTLAVLAAASAHSLELNEQWSAFKTSHGKAYLNSVEESTRFAIFQSNLNKINEHNKKFDAGESSYKMGVNQFTDLTAEEFMEFLKLSGPMPKIEGAKTFVPKRVAAADSVDWRQQGVVTPVKNQGQCGSCWSFSTTGSMEGQVKLATGQLNSYSEQCLVDCDTNNSGCSGGWMSSALDYIRRNGIPTEDQYPYEAKDGSCRYNGGGTKIAEVYELTSYGDENNLKLAVDQIGPISVSMDATERLQSYSSGVLNDDVCDSQTINHGVLAVGYGTENGQDYWLIKNSWGAGWGEAGYFRIVRNKGNQCGIANYGFFPTV